MDTLSLSRTTLRCSALLSCRAQHGATMTCTVTRQERAAAMLPKYKGPCCDGTKKWGDGKGSHDKAGKLFYECMACRRPLSQLGGAASQ